MSTPGEGSELDQLHRVYFHENSHRFDLSTAEGCGQYTEAFVDFAQSQGYSKVGHLKKVAPQTRYRGHAVDAILWAEPTHDGLLQSIDIIQNAEQKKPWKPNTFPDGRPGNDPPRARWGLDIPRYSTQHWLKQPIESEVPSGGNNMSSVPYAPYNENGFQRLKKMLAHDYARRPQGADFDVTIWAARFFHNHYFGPTGIPLSESDALKRVKVELCNALGVTNDGYLGE